MTAASSEQAHDRPRRGRPPSTRTQEAIRAAARRLFAGNGFTRTSVRDVAAAAGVDPSLVIRHFGSKEQLFLQAIAVDEGFRGLTEGPREQLGRLLLARVVQDGDGSAVDMWSALIGAVDQPEVKAYMTESMRRHIVGPLAARLTGPDAELRARLVAVQIQGLLMVLSTMRDDPPLGEVLDVYARALQALIDEPAA